MQTEFTTRSLFTTFFRQKGKFFLVFLLIVLGGVGYLINATPLYQADGSLLVKFGNNAIPDVALDGKTSIELSQNDRREVIQSNSEMLKSHDLLLALVDEFGVDTLYPGTTERVGKSDSPAEVAVRRLGDDINIKSGQQSNVINVQYLNQDAALAAQLVHRLFEVFISRQTEVYNNPQTEFLQHQVELAAARLQKSQKVLQEFKAKEGISSMEEEQAQLLKEKSDAETIGFQSVDDAQSRLDGLQAKRNTILSTYRPDSPQAKQVEASIALAQAQLTNRQNDLKRKGSVKVLSSHVAAISGRIKDLEDKRNHYQDLERQVEIDEESYKTLRVHSEEAIVNEALNQKKITHISIVDEPVAQIKPARPRKMLILAASLLAGLIFGLGTAMLFETFDERFSLPSQVSATLNTPMMASFSAQAEG